DREPQSAHEHSCDARKDVVVVPLGLKNLQSFMRDKQQPKADNCEIGTQIEQADPHSVHWLSPLDLSVGCPIGEPHTVRRLLRSAHARSRYRSWPRWQPHLYSLHANRRRSLCDRMFFFATDKHLVTDKSGQQCRPTARERGRAPTA